MNNKKIQEYYNGNLKKICRITDKFNIFKIKWNRIILDEAHEKLNPVVQLFSTSIKNYTSGHHKINHDDQYLYENLAYLRANYKWALTGTPAQSGLDNIMGILQFLTKKNIFEDHHSVVEKIRYFTNLVGIRRDNMDTILKKTFKKTFKKDVKKLLNIPLFTEDIIYVDQTNIERNIYNTIRCSRHFTEAVKLRRLFLMCTNILINEGYDLDSNNEITTEVLTLEQLNANMIAKFTEQLRQLGANETRMIQANELLNTRLGEWEKVVSFLEELNLDTLLSETVLTEIKTNFGNLDKPSVRTNLDLIYNLLDIFTVYKDPSTAGMILFTNLMSFKPNFIRFWKTVWENENTCNKIAYYGAKYAPTKINDEIHKNNRKLEGMNTDKKRINNQIALFSNNEFLKEKTADPCIICFEDLQDVVVTPCRHIFCLNCTKHLSQELKHNFTCPECRTPITCNTLNITTVAIINGENKQKADTEIEPEQLPIKANNELSALEKKLGSEWKNKCINKYGSKMATLVEYLHKLFEDKQNRVIIFSQYDKMLKMIGKTLDEFGIKFVYCQGNNYVINKNINKFKKDDSIRVIMLSSETSNSGSNLTEANYIIFIDVLYQDKQHVKATEAQAIGRAVRLGQKLPVKVVRFITRGTIEDEHFTKNRYDMNTLQE
jgi:SNF2 family DNA or RNA helicase